MSIELLEKLQKIDRSLNDLPESKQKEIREHLRELQIWLNGYPY